MEEETCNVDMNDDDKEEKKKTLPFGWWLMIFGTK